LGDDHGLEGGGQRDAPWLGCAGKRTVGKDALYHGAAWNANIRYVRRTGGKTVWPWEKNLLTTPLFCYPESNAISPQPMMGWLVSRCSKITVTLKGPDRHKGP
jgi:hypothetical protein